MKTVEDRKNGKEKTVENGWVWLKTDKTVENV